MLVLLGISGSARDKKKSPNRLFQSAWGFAISTKTYAAWQVF
jgi:hypothetical protein